MSAMAIEIKNGKRIITHPSGVVSIYDKAHYENRRNQMQQFSAQFEQLDNLIAEIEASEISKEVN